MAVQSFSVLQQAAASGFFLLWWTIGSAMAHSRWKCPAPRNPDTGIKTGPCGSETNNFSTADSMLELQPGPLRVYYEESIYHTGAPFRIALSGDGTDDEVCVLLDHIPHNDDLSSVPNLSDPSTYTQYSITINIPDVQCERCSLHLVNPMTDKIGDDGAPDGVGCTDPNGSCFSVYHSCTVPFRILGSIARADYTCPALSTDWPTQWTGDGGVSVDASMAGIYRREASVWSSDGFLQTVPEVYRLDVGGVCGSLGEVIYAPPIGQPVPSPTEAPTGQAVSSSTETPIVQPIPSSTETPTGQPIPSSTKTPGFLVPATPSPSPVARTGSPTSSRVSSSSRATDVPLRTERPVAVDPAANAPTQAPPAQVEGTPASPNPTAGANENPALSVAGTSSSSSSILLKAQNALITSIPYIFTFALLSREIMSQ